jgi:hypothetical protein
MYDGMKAAMQTLYKHLQGWEHASSSISAIKRAGRRCMGVDEYHHDDDYQE